MEWWVIALGFGAGAVAERHWAKTDWEPRMLAAIGIGIATIFLVSFVGYKVQQDDCQIWRQQVFDRANRIYNPATMTEEEADAIAYDSMERFRPTFC